MSDVRQWLLEVSEEVFEDAVETIEEASSEARDAMKIHIETTPGKEQWDGDWTGFQRREGKPLRYGSTPGAVHTGKMVNSVGSRVTRGNNTAEAEAGWIDEGSWEEYFQYQEQGFRNVLAGVNVEGLHALETASQVAEAVLRRKGYHG